MSFLSFSRILAEQVQATRVCVCVCVCVYVCMCVCVCACVCVDFLNFFLVSIFWISLYSKKAGMDMEVNAFILSDSLTFAISEQSLNGTPMIPGLYFSDFVFFNRSLFLLSLSLYSSRFSDSRPLSLSLSLSITAHTPLPPPPLNRNNTLFATPTRTLRRACCKKL
jgi:hypothetical protein